jgi:hypothetical protein
MTPEEIQARLADESYVGQIFAIGEGPRPRLGDSDELRIYEAAAELVRLRHTIKHRRGWRRIAAGIHLNGKLKAFVQSYPIL